MTNKEIIVLERVEQTINEIDERLVNVEKFIHTFNGVRENIGLLNAITTELNQSIKALDMKNLKDFVGISQIMTDFQQKQKTHSDMIQRLIGRFEKLRCVKDGECDDN
jgi:cell fate (sporulation/competence/biofilm development) regulator YmcA (YheA/YmcA/DUF963 family)